ncbi:class I SAM-dependent methyltransferase [Bradyrhizobium sp. MOS003]|nr:class I SAM-dependent methyltransferase [Bradyrhizobium sp. MOS003]
MDTGRCRSCGGIDLQRTVSRESYVGGGQTLRRCGICAAVYLAPDFTPESLDLFYREHYRRLFPSETIWRSEQRFFAWRGDRPVADIRLARIEPHLPTGAHLLEIGSGFGAFLGAAATLQGVRLSAIEPDVANRGRLLGSANVDFVRSIEATSRGSIDVVVAFHVVEHLADPLASLREIHAALKVGGRAFVEVPDLMQGLLSPSYFHPAHLSYFTVPTLSRLAGAAGFRIVQAGPHPDGGILTENIWLEVEKPSTAAVAPRALAALPEEVAAVDALLDAVDWRASPVRHWRRTAKHLALAMFGPGLVGELQRFRQWRQLRRIGWT